jgi:hypothetical protein
VGGAVLGDAGGRAGPLGRGAQSVSAHVRRTGTPASIERVSGVTRQS